MMFFSNHFILSHFRFARFLLNILCVMNMETQERFAIRHRLVVNERNKGSVSKAPR